MDKQGTNNGPPPMIGVDVGGTHTDVCLSVDGTLTRGKALTSHDGYSRGILEAIGVAAETVGRSLPEMLGETETIVAGTTVVTNALTELRGAKAGVLITRGFRDTFRFAGGARQPIYDDHLQHDPPDLVAREDIIEIDERISPEGVLAPLDEAAVRAAVRELRSRDVVAVAVCYLWSFQDSSHEQRTREIILEEWPDALVTLSSEVFSMMREHERFYTCVFNCFCQPAAHILLDNLVDELRKSGFEGDLSIFAGAGGAIPIELARRFPVLLLASGPAGGVTGAVHLATAMGHQNLMVGDMGGTSFDTSLVEGLKPTITSRTSVNGIDTGISIVDIISVGAGGGSLAWVDDRGVPQVGPQSAGSMPGPACYGRGGEQATVTDAAVVAGMIDPDNYLNGRMTLDASASDRVVQEFATSFGRNREEGANAILNLTVESMASALRTVSVERGHDPRRYAMFAYGGTLPLFAARICERLDMGEVVIPGVSSVFSAYGVLAADFIRRYSRTVELALGPESSADELSEIRKAMAEAAAEEVADGGLDLRDGTLSWEISVRFHGQTFEITTPIADIDSLDLGAVHDEFPAVYEKTYGKGTAWKGSPVVLSGLNLNVSIPRRSPEFAKPPHIESKVEVVPKAHRLILQPDGSFTEVPVYEGAEFPERAAVAGAAIIDERDTTLVIPVGWVCERDRFSNYVLKGSGR
jgi:N-methylhydantoinase A